MSGPPESSGSGHAGHDIVEEGPIVRIWPVVRNEISGAWRSLRYDLSRRAESRPAGQPGAAEDPYRDSFEASPRRAVISTGVAALVVTGAVGSYLGVANGLGALLDDAPNPGSLPTVSGEDGAGARDADRSPAPHGRPPVSVVRSGVAAAGPPPSAGPVGGVPAAGAPVGPVENVPPGGGAPTAVPPPAGPPTASPSPTGSATAPVPTPTTPGATPDGSSVSPSPDLPVPMPAPDCPGGSPAPGSPVTPSTSAHRPSPGPSSASPSAPASRQHRLRPAAPGALSGEPAPTVIHTFVTYAPGRAGT